LHASLSTVEKQRNIKKETRQEAKEITNSKHEEEETSAHVSDASAITMENLVIMKRIVKRKYEISNAKCE